jgi:hypothetical protein
MDAFVAGCQGLGLALAAGAFAGASGRRGAPGALLALVAIVAGGALFGWSLDREDHPAWPGFVAGAIVAAASFAVVRRIAEGAAARAQEAGYTGALIALAALALAGLSLLFGPLSLVALVGLGAIAAGQRRREGQRYEGLRTLR